MSSKMKHELTWQAVVGAILVSSLISLAYPYIVLKMGLGPNVSVLSAFLGALFLQVTAQKTRGQNRLMNNIIQTAGTSATSTAFMCVVAAAFGYLNLNETVKVHVTITPWEMFTWLTCSGTIGVLFIVLFRRYFLDDPQMVFADGVAAAETINVLDSEKARGKLQTLSLGSLIGVGVSFFRDGLGLIPLTFIAQRFKIGIEWNVLSVGTGILVGLRMGLSMLLGTVIVFFAGPLIMDRVGMDIIHGSIAPQYLAQCNALATLTPETLKAQQPFLTQHCGMMGDYLKGNHFGIILLWLMWPASALMITAAITAVALEWKSLVQMFRTLSIRQEKAPQEDIPLKIIFPGVLVLTLLLAYVQNVHFGMTYPQTFFAVFCELPLMLVGVRVLGETNQGPVSLMANALQAVFAVFWPQQIALNLIAAGMAGDGNAQAEGTMQDFRTGQIVGSTPWILTCVQLCAIPIGAAAVAIMYPLLIARYGLGGDGLVAPTGLKLANMAVLLSKGISAFPQGALTATAIAAFLGVVLTLLETRYKIRWLPSAAGLGFALILPGLLNIPVAIGALFGWLWQKLSPESYAQHHITLASGLIGGEALIAGLLLPALFYFGILGA
jgi:uncharacterized oligopeptide transporter (OPT) family protein